MNNNEILEKAKNIRLLDCDVDGVLTTCGDIKLFLIMEMRLNMEH
jgi:3-deoxy-D-manno-octulosonate 8-phosphate phosphatase KdsC-like HAD superfamily phosphatase